MEVIQVRLYLTLTSLWDFVVSPGSGTEYKLSRTKGIAITVPGSLIGLCSSSARKLPEAALRWKSRGVKLYLPGSEKETQLCDFDSKVWRAEGEVLTGAPCGCSTMQHAVVGLPVHQPQGGPELCRL